MRIALATPASPPSLQVYEYDLAVLWLFPKPQPNGTTPVRAAALLSSAAWGSRGTYLSRLQQD